MNFDRAFGNFNDTISAIITDEDQLEECLTASENLMLDIEYVDNERSELEDQVYELEKELREKEDLPDHDLAINLPIDTVYIYMEKKNLLLTQIFEVLEQRLKGGNYNKILEDLK